MINNDDYEIAWKNQENQNIINSASKRFRGIIPEDDMKSCQMVGLWHSLSKFDGGYQSTFFTYLYNGIVMECRKWLSNNKRYMEANKKRKHIVLDSIISKNGGSDQIELDDIVSKLPDELHSVLKQRFYENMTLEEISTINGYTKETARRKIKAGVSKLRKYFKN